MDSVAEAFASVPRAGFLPAAQRSRAEYDGPIPIGYGQTNSQPHTVENMLRLLDVRPGIRVLDVGSGSGWTTALLAHLVGPKGSVLGLELVPELAQWGAANLGSAYPWARIEPADRRVLGDPAGAPYDRILVSAGAGRMPDALVEQLADPGRMVVPVRGTMMLVEHRSGEVRVTAHGRYRFVPLR